MKEYEEVELVIRIPKITYEATKRYKAISIARDEDITEWILTGKVLPKGHDRLIEAKAIMDCKCKNNFNECDVCVNEELCELVNNAPTIIEADKEGE